MAFPTLSATQKDAFDRILADAVASKSLPALFFGITTADGPIYMHQEGTKLVDDPASEAIDEDTVFWLCSQTKMITSIAALQLIDQGKITFDTPVESILPELAAPVVVTQHDDAGRPSATVPAKGKITFGQLLNHSSGLDYNLDGTTPASGMPVAYSHSYKDEDVSAFFNILKGSLPGVPLRFEPGTNYAYGFSTDCAGFVVERLSGKSLEQYFQDHIFAPLGITSASFYLTPTLKERLLPLSFRVKTGALERWKRPSVIDVDPANVRVHMGGVGVYASQKDYLAILQHLLQIQAGTANTPILSRASVDSMFASTLPAAGAASLSATVPLGVSFQFGRGLCVNTADIPGKRRAGSGTWGGWANTSFFVDPATGVAAVFATQLVPAGDAAQMRLYELLEREMYSGLGAKL
ncbi:beta-lactamase/transpeptidase-like protein [Mycena alexandri]|uniref:Beta-lactamase/transpeptidase-like protein n=1 Tax=Mycena alexandri TaxID=1745969 RepID=A0AAD6WLM6_9AGAR|nr:beta-lactamase/transpeptidase-like protein [Mycena alexandri]